MVGVLLGSGADAYLWPIFSLCPACTRNWGLFSFEEDNMLGWGLEKCFKVGLTHLRLEMRIFIRPEVPLSPAADRRPYIPTDLEIIFKIGDKENIQ